VTTAEKLVKLLAEKRLTCATAESCTGGGVGCAITAVPGSSAVFKGGVVSYDNSVKRDLLGVPERTLAEHGAVSAECAAAMAEGVRRLEGFAQDGAADCLAVAITGIAGPGGGSAEKPVGLVWFATASGAGVAAEKRIFPGSRAAVREAAVEHALRLLLAAADSACGDGSQSV
jgi:PncC family amidohydrolase